MWRGSGAGALGPSSYSMGTAYRYNTSYPTKYVGGDGYFPTWSDDGSLYVVTDDSYGWQYAGGNVNMEIGKLDGYTAALTGTSVNKMLAWGGISQAGSSGYDWKMQALISVGTVLYGNITQAWPANGPGVNPWLPALQSQVIKSTDHGATWTPSPPSTAQPYASPMFPNLSMGGYVQYGQNYTGTGVDNSGTYVYAYFIANGSGVVGSYAMLGRVTIANLPNLNGADWTFYQGGDGLLSANWGAIGTAAQVIAEATPAGQAPKLFWLNVQYLPAFSSYVATPAFWPTSNPATTYIQVWRATNPWGPWVKIGADYDTTAIGGLYGVSIAPSSVAADGGRTTMLMAGGNFQLIDAQTGQYCLHLLPLTLS